MELILNKENHQYFLGNKKLVSVSEIINKYLGCSYTCKKCNLNVNECLCKNTCKFCDNVRNACKRGNAVHKTAELFFKFRDKEKVIEVLEKKVKEKYKNHEKILSYLTSFLDLAKRQYFLNETDTYISEKSFSYDFVAGTPDFISTNKVNTSFIYDIKTYANMTDDLLKKTKLQLTGYYWLLLNNGFNVSNNAFIVWVKNVKNYETKIIDIEITKELILQWELARNNYKEINNAKLDNNA